mgnify:CR=1 FL=1
MSSFSDVDRALKHNHYIKFGSNGQIVTNVKINLSKQNVFLEMDKLNSEKNEIDSFTAQCTYILNQGLTK